MKKITTQTATIYMDKNEIVHMKILGKVRIDFEDALDNALVINNLRGEIKVLKLIDASEGFSIDKKAREFVRQVDLKQTRAKAVVTRSTISRLLLCFFTELSRPKIQTKIFSDYEDAYNWLLKLKE